MIINSNIKHNARLRLRGNWTAALCILGLTVGASTAVALLQSIGQLLTNTSTDVLDGANELSQLLTSETLVNGALSLLFSIIICALQIFAINLFSLGSDSFYWKNANGENPNAGVALTWFAGGKYMRGVGACFLVNFYESLWALVCLAPGFFMLFFTYEFADSEYRDSLIVLALFTAGALLMSVGLYVFLRVIQRYFLVTYLLTAYDNLSSSEAIALSRTMMHSYGRDSLYFQLSFLGWYLLCLFVLPVMYVFPYVNQAFAEYAKAIIDAENQKAEEARRRHEEAVRRLYTSNPYDAPAAPRDESAQ